MIVVVVKYLIRKGFRGFTAYPFIVFAEKEDRHDPVLLNHEKIHLRQQAEFLVLPFFVWYLAEYFIRLLKYRNTNLAYRNISFEREAYANEKSLHYLHSRNFFAFLKYI